MLHASRAIHGSGTPPEMALIDGPVSTIAKSSDGALWFGGEHQGRSGAARHNPTAGSKPAWRIFTPADGLFGPNIASGVASTNGDVWFGTKVAVGRRSGTLRWSSLDDLHDRARSASPKDLQSDGIARWYYLGRHRLGIEPIRWQAVDPLPPLS